MAKKIKLKLPKERNPFVQHLVSKTGGGYHGKSKKAQRRDDKASLRKGNSNQDDFDKVITFSKSSFGPLVEWFNKGFLIPAPGFDSQRVLQNIPM